MARPSGVAGAIVLSLERLFKLDNVTRIASVELWVLLTTLLLLVRFLIYFKGPWFGKPGSIRMFIVLTLEILNQNLVIYTMGLMQLSGARKVNDYFQVWAVLLVTLQYSVKIGRPYTRSKQVPLLDLMSSFWSANLLRVQTFYLLRFPLWTIWSLNAVRIIFLFVSSGKGETNNQESMRLVSDYMSYEHTLSKQKKSSEMDIWWPDYKYLVYGEHRVLQQVKEGNKREGRRTLSSCFRKRRQVKSESSSSSYKIQLYPDGVHKEQLVTLETIWNPVWKNSSDSGLLGVGTAAEHRRDLCLSFALYKLLRRRFYHLPMREMDQQEGKKKMRQLVFDYILKNKERAFRITWAELSFLQDLFYSKHATVFAGGLLVPLWSLLLSLCLATATGYIAYPARYIPERMDPADRNRITHGVFITRLMVGIIVLKEMLEIVLYLWSRWAKVLLLCKYAQLQHCPVVEAAMRWFVVCFQAISCVICCPFSFCCRANLTKVRQQNLLVKSFPVFRPIPLLPMRFLRLRGEIPGTANLKDYTKDAIFEQLKRLDLDSRKEEITPFYFSNAFGSKSKELEWPCHRSAVDTHIILVWHIATSLCEIYSSNKKVKKLSATGQIPRPFLPAQQHNEDGSTEPAWYEHYSTAVTLSNYCVYLVSKALVPDNGIIARKVLDEVIREIDYAVCGIDHKPWKKLFSSRTWWEMLFPSIKLEGVYNRLMKRVDKPSKNYDHHQSRGPNDEEAAATTQDDHHQVDYPEQAEQDDDDDYKDLDIGHSLTRTGVVLEQKLTEVYHGDTAGLWEGLAKFWTGFLIHLAANTGAATHGRHLAGDSELITHLWALLTHAGYRGNAVHGEQGLDQEDVPDIDQEAAKS